MCGCDGVPATVSTSSFVRPRKSYPCDECGCAIRVGEVHEFTSGLWDGEWSSFRVCSDCVAFRVAWLTWVASLPPGVRPQICWSFQSLGEAIACSLEEHAENVRDSERHERTIHPAIPMRVNA